MQHLHCHRLSAHADCTIKAELKDVQHLQCHRLLAHANCTIKAEFNQMQHLQCHSLSAHADCTTLHGACEAQLTGATRLPATWLEHRWSLAAKGSYRLSNSTLGSAVTELLWLVAAWLHPSSSQVTSCLVVHFYHAPHSLWSRLTLTAFQDLHCQSIKPRVVFGTANTAFGLMLHEMPVTAALSRLWICLKMTLHKACLCSCATSQGGWSFTVIRCTHSACQQVLLIPQWYAALYWPWIHNSQAWCHSSLGWLHAHFCILFLVLTFYHISCFAPVSHNPTFELSMIWSSVAVVETAQLVKACPWKTAGLFKACLHARYQPHQLNRCAPASSSHWTHMLLRACSPYAAVTHNHTTHHFH